MIAWIKDNPTLVIAIYGTILSTIAILWNIYNNLQDRPKIKVTGKFGFMGLERVLMDPSFLLK